jgi:hypothetical protein
MPMEFSRTVEEIVATRVFITATDGFLDLSAMGSAGEGGIVNIGAKNMRLASDAGSLSVASTDDGDGDICLRSSGERGSILLTTPGTGKTARLRMRPDGVEIVFGDTRSPCHLRMQEDRMELAMGADGARVILEGDTLTLGAGNTKLVLGPAGIHARTASGDIPLAHGNAPQPLGKIRP